MATIGLLQDEVYQPAVPTERQSEISSFIAAEMTRAMNEFLTSPELANRIASNVESVFALSEHAGAPTPPAAATAGAYARALIATTDARDESMASTNYIGNSDYSTNESIHESVGNGGRKSVVANVPRIEGNVRLDGDGEFQTDVDLHALSNTHRLQRSSLGSSTVSFNMEVREERREERCDAKIVHGMNGSNRTVQTALLKPRSRSLVLCHGMKARSLTRPSSNTRFARTGRCDGPPQEDVIPGGTWAHIHGCILSPLSKKPRHVPASLCFIHTECVALCLP